MSGAKQRAGRSRLASVGKPLASSKKSTGCPRCARADASCNEQGAIGSMHACAIVGAALLLLVDAMVPGPEGPVNTTSLNNWHHAQQLPICSRNTSLSKAIGVIPPLINTVYYTGRSDSDLKHLTAMHGGPRGPLNRVTSGGRRTTASCTMMMRL